MNEQIEKLMYHSGLTAQGCWDEMDEYAKQGIHKFAELIVRECANWIKTTDPNSDIGTEDAQALLEHFGVTE